MPQTISGVNVYADTMSTVSAGDPAAASVIRGNLQTLLNDAVFLNTALGFQAFDSRGKTTPITGPIVLTNSGGSVDFEVTLRLGDDVDVFADLTIHTGHNLVNAGTTDLRGNVTIGGSGAQNLTVNSTVQFNAPIFLHDDLTSGHLVTTSELIVTGNADLQGTTQLATADVNEGLSVTGDTTLAGNLSLAGNAQIGDSSTDSHIIRGDVHVRNDIQVDGTLDVAGTLTLSGSNNDLGSSATVGAFQTTGDTTIGNNSSDSVTFNAQLAGALSMGANGRVLTGLSEISSSQPLTLSSPRFVVCTQLASGTINLTIDDAGMAVSDQFLLYLSPFPGATIHVSSNNGTGFFNATARSMALAIRTESFGWLIVGWNLD